MAGRDSVLLVQCSSSVDIRKMVTDLCGIPVETEENLIERMTWKLSNKYYDADVTLMSTRGRWRDCMSREELECVDGLVIAFDPTEENSFDLVKEWLTFVKEHKPAILLLVCNTFPAGEHVVDGLSRQDVIEWCIEHSFELVELDAESEVDEDDVGVGFMEKVGVARISEAIQTNTWPNMRKNVSSQQHAAAAATTISLESKSKQADGRTQVGNTQKTIDALLPEDLPLHAGLGDDDAGAESFEELFSKMMEMKEKAASLPDKERKEYAEKVALSFWQALGGDKLDSDEEEET